MEFEWNELETTDQTIKGNDVYYMTRNGRRVRVVIKTCPECGEKFAAQGSKVKEGKGTFCSRSCATKANNRGKTGSDNPAWKGKVAFVEEKKSEGECQECGEEEDLHFHHPDDVEKVASVSRIAREGEYSLGDVKDEVEKCILLCDHCHVSSHATGRSSKLTEEDVREIRERYEGDESQSDIARDFPISRRTVSNIVRRDSWDHVD